MKSQSPMTVWQGVRGPCSIILLAFLVVLLPVACVHPVSLVFPSFDGVVHYESVPGASEKFDLQIVSDNDEKIFKQGRLLPATALGQNGISLFYPGRTLPAWLKISWRGPRQRDGTGVLRDGLIVEHRVDVGPRIPPALLHYAKASEHRMVILTLRIADDEVLLSWSVRETAYDPVTHHAQHVYSLYGGDLSCQDPGGEVQQAKCTAGYLQDAPWYQSGWKFI